MAPRASRIEHTRLNLVTSHTEFIDLTNSGASPTNAQIDSSTVEDVA